MKHSTSLSQGVGKRKNGKSPNHKIGHLSLDTSLRRDRSVQTTGLVARFIRDNNLVYCQVSSRKLGYPTEIYFLGRIDQSGFFQWMNVSRLSSGGNNEILEIYHSDSIITERESTNPSNRGGILLSKNLIIEGKIFRKQTLMTKWSFLERLGIDPNQIDEFESMLERQGYKLPKNTSLGKARRLTTKKDKDKRKKIISKIEFR